MSIEPNIPDPEKYAQPLRVICKRYAPKMRKDAKRACLTALGELYLADREHHDAAGRQHAGLPARGGKGK